MSDSNVLDALVHSVAIERAIVDRLSRLREWLKSDDEVQRVRVVVEEKHSTIQETQKEIATLHASLTTELKEACERRYSNREQVMAQLRISSGKHSKLLLLQKSMVKMQMDLLEVLTNVERKAEDRDGTLSKAVDVKVPEEPVVSVKPKKAATAVPRVEDKAVAAKAEVAVEASPAAQADRDVIEGEWMGTGAGGCMNYPTWRNNTQYFLDVSEDAKITLALTQLGTKEGMGFYVLPGDGGGKRLLMPTKPVGKSVFGAQPEISCALDLKARDGGYVVMPCTFYPGKETKYTLKLSTLSGSASISPMEDSWITKRVDSEWEGQTCGGCRNHATFPYNPQFKVHVPAMAGTEEVEVRIVVTSEPLDRKNKGCIMGAYMYRLPQGATTKLVHIDPKNLLLKGNFASMQEASVSMRLKTGGDYLFIPCTFEPGIAQKFTIFLYSEEVATISPLLDTQEVSVDGSWTDLTAGGCFNYSSWRHNPQYTLWVPKAAAQVSLRLVQHNEERHAIGLCVFKGQRRRLVVRAGDLVDSAPCTATTHFDFTLNVAELRKEDEKERSGAATSRSRAQSVSVISSSDDAPDGGDDMFIPFVIMPCTFYPGKEGDFTLSVFAPKDCAPPVIVEPKKNWHYKAVESKWDSESAGGCLNFRSWRQNPQFRITNNSEEKAKMMVLVSVPQEAKKHKLFRSIGFYVCRSSSPTGHVMEITEKTIAKKGPFRRSHETYCMVNAKPGESFTLIPCTYHAELETQFSLSVFSTTDMEIEKLPLLSPVASEKGSWSKETAGGSMSYMSWFTNPRLELTATSASRVALVLLQGGPSGGNTADLKPIGFSVSKTTESGELSMSEPSDLVGRTPFEATTDVCCELDLEPSKTIVVPATFEPGLLGDYELKVYVMSGPSDGVSLKALPPQTLEEALNSEAGKNVVVEEVEECEDTGSAEESESNAESTTEHEKPVEKSVEADPVASSGGNEGDKPEEAAPVPTPPPAGADGGPPPPPTMGTTAPKVAPASKPAKVSTNSTAGSGGGSLLDQIAKGTRLRKVETNAQKAKPNNSIFKAFDVDRIVARRAALEFSDEEEDDQDDDDWWDDEDD